MKVLDVLSYDIPNVFKTKDPKKVVLKKDKSVYGADIDVDAATDGGAPSSGEGGTQ